MNDMRDKTDAMTIRKQGRHNRERAPHNEDLAVDTDPHEILKAYLASVY